MSNKNLSGAVGESAQPFIFHVSEVARGNGMPVEIDQFGPSPEQLGLSMIHLPKGRQVEVNATATPLGDAIMIEADITGVFDMECTLCLSKREVEVSTPATQVFSLVEQLVTGDTDDEEDDFADEVLMVDGDEMDMLQPAIDAIGLELPFNPVCADFDLECDNSQVPPLSDYQDEVEEAPIDPRWAGLAKFAQGE